MMNSLERSKEYRSLMRGISDILMGLHEGHLTSAVDSCEMSGNWLCVSQMMKEGVWRARGRGEDRWEGVGRASEAHGERHFGGVVVRMGKEGAVGRRWCGCGSVQGRDGGDCGGWERDWGSGGVWLVWWWREGGREVSRQQCVGGRGVVGGLRGGRGVGAGEDGDGEVWLAGEGGGVLEGWVVGEGCGWGMGGGEGGEWYGIGEGGRDRDRKLIVSGMVPGTGERVGGYGGGMRRGGGGLGATESGGKGAKLECGGGGLDSGGDGQAFLNPGIQNVGNQNELIVVPGIANTECNSEWGMVSLQLPRAKTQLLIAQKEEARIQLQAKEFDLMAVAGDLDKIKEVNANCILMANLQQASTSDTQTDKAPVYDSDGSAEYTELLDPIIEPHQVQQNNINVISVNSNVEHNGGTVGQHPATVEETRAYFESLYNHLVTKVEKVNAVNRKMKETNADLTTELAGYRVDARVQNFENHFVKEAAKFIRDFKSLAKEADSSLDKITVLEKENERLLRAVVSRDIISIVQSPFLSKHLNSKLSLNVLKKAYNDMKTTVERFACQLGDHRVPPKVVETNGLSNLVTSNLVPTTKELKILKNDKVIAPGMFRINPSMTSRERKLYAISQAEKESKVDIILRPRGYCLEQYKDMSGPPLRSRVVASRIKKLNEKLIESSDSEYQSDNSKGSNACASNPKEPTSKRFPNSTSFLGRVTKFRAIADSNSVLGWSVFVVSDLVVAFKVEKKTTSYVRNLEGVDLLKGNRTTNLYTINLYEMASISPICLIARATFTNSWLWLQRLSHLNFDTLNDLAKNNLVTGLPKFKYHKKHLCPSFLLQAPVIVKERQMAQNSKIKCLKNTLTVLASLTKRLLSEHLNKMESWNTEIVRLDLAQSSAPSIIKSQKPTERELDLLFEAMYDDYIGGQPSTASRNTPAAPAPQVLQAPTTSTTIADTASTPTNSSSQVAHSPKTLHNKTVADNFPNAMFDGGVFENLFAPPSTSAAESSSSQYVDP
ncbi:retrovirus-related pol polyprotein from transposon TNT 1-94 [Tanacetum coccineum]